MHKAKLNAILPEQVNLIVALDFGPFVETARKNKYLLIITDL